MKIIDKIAWIYIKNRKVLFVQTKGKDLAYTVGGKREQGESDVEALNREVKEEVDVDLKIESIKFLEIFTGHAHGNDNDTQVKITCYTSEFIGDIKPQNEIEKLVWLTSSDADKTTDTGHLILNYLKEKDLID